jgi:NADH-quinone oxidoreductase subunit L
MSLLQTHASSVEHGAFGGFEYGLLLAVPLIPLLGYALQIALRRKLPFGDKLLTLGMGAVMAITVFMALKAIRHHGPEPFFHESVREGHGWSFRWLYQTLGWDSPANVAAGILYDPLGAVLLAVVGIVSFCVHLFSQGYMHGDKRYNIFFANISLFTFAMLGLVLSDNILFFFVFWELMGFMSYSLIGHFSHDPGNPYFHRWATWACKKAFLTTRVGDVCLFVGMLMFFGWKDQELGRACMSFRFTDLWAHAQAVVAANGGQFPAWMITAGLFVFGGTVGKSAQFPLHIWLPDAMAGPTPVSAMIHAATMVAAGVFLLGRTFPLMAPEVLTVVTVVGATTALFAATIGMTAFDLKAVLAWSTISQLGFMVAAVGLGGVVAGMFHMTTHAFFKACLFLSAGAVIHACHHEQDMRRMGGLRVRLPITFLCMLACTLAIAGVPFFSGFYSKDMILMAGWEGVLGHTFDGWKIYATVALSLAAIMTAFYMFRMVFMTFFGSYRGEVHAGGHGHAEHGHHALEHSAKGQHAHAHAHAHAEKHAEHGHGHGGHDAGHGHHEIEHAEDGGIAHGHGGPLPREVGWQMAVPLLILAALGIFGGDFPSADYFNIYHPHPWFTHLATLESLYPNVAGWLGERFPVDEHVAHVAHARAFYSSVFLIAPLGILLAWFLYVRRRDLPAKITSALGILYETVAHRYYIDEFANALAIRPTMAAAQLLKLIDEKVVDGLVLLVGTVNRFGGSFSAAFDRIVVDGLVNLVGLVSQTFGAVSRLLQTGRIQQYAAFAVGGGLLAAAWLILS